MESWAPSHRNEQARGRLFTRIEIGLCDSPILDFRDPVGRGPKRFTVTDEPWVVEVEYEEIGEYPPAMTVSSQQRVGVVLELFDAGENPTSPQASIQALPVAMDMLRLGVLQQPIQPRIVIRT